MKIGFYSPYLDSLSGGERYVLTLASHWSKTHDVALFWDDLATVRKAESRLHIDLSRARTVENVFKTRNIFRKMIVSRGYDLIFFLSDGSIPTTFARYNILHFQVPFQNIQVHSIKLGRYQRIVCNSDFTKRNIVEELGKRAVVIYPPVMPVRHARVSKKNIILSIGRFHHLKKQDVLVEAFRKGKFADYELILAGNLLPADEEYFKRLKHAAKGLDVRFFPNISFEKLTGLYNQSSIYWHSTGYHETKPENMEHFGISTVEAMSAGAVPVVFNGGGLPETVQEGENGYLWANIPELLDKTRKVISGGGRVLAKNAITRSEDFSPKRFMDAFDQLLTDIIR